MQRTMYRQTVKIPNTSAQITLDYKMTSQSVVKIYHDFIQITSKSNWEMNKDLHIHLEQSRADQDQHKIFSYN